MTEAIYIILAILSTYRISRMIVGETGPFSIFDNLRGYLTEKYPTDHWVRNGIVCPLCVSFWIAAVTAVFTAPDAYSFFLHWAGIAGAVALIYRNLE